MKIEKILGVLAVLITDSDPDVKSIFHGAVEGKNQTGSRVTFFFRKFVR